MSSALLGPDPRLLDSPYAAGLTDVWSNAPGYGTIYFGPQQWFERDLAVLWMDTQRRQRILDAGKIPVLWFTYYPAMTGITFASRFMPGFLANYAPYGYALVSGESALLGEYMRIAQQQIKEDMWRDATGQKRVRLFTSDGIPAYRFDDMTQAIFASQLTEQQRIDNATLAIAERAGLSPQQVVDISSVAPTNPIAAQYVQALIAQRLAQLGLAHPATATQAAVPAAATQLPATSPASNLASQITQLPAQSVTAQLLPPITATATATPAASDQTPSNALASGTPATIATGTQNTTPAVTAANAIPSAQAATLAGVPLATIDQGTTVMRLIAAAGSIWFMFKKR